MSSLAPSPTQPKPVQASLPPPTCRENTVVAVVLAILGAALLATGLFLLLGSVGTIPAGLIGFAYSLGGAALFLGSAYTIFRSFK